MNKENLSLDNLKTQLGKVIVTKSKYSDFEKIKILYKITNEKMWGILCTDILEDCLYPINNEGYPTFCHVDKIEYIRKPTKNEYNNFKKLWITRYKKDEIILQNFISYFPFKI